MNRSTSGEKEEPCCSGLESASPCCDPAAGTLSSCCSPRDVPLNKGKLILSLLIILAAIGVGVHSLVKGSSAQSGNTGPAKSFVDKITEMPITSAGSSYQGRPQTSPQEISVNLVLDSVQALDKLAADKDAVFLVLPGGTQVSSVGIPDQVATVANNLWRAGKRIGVFTLRNSSPDHVRLAGHFMVKSFPCVIVLGRQGPASAVSGDISEARLYNAFVLASTPASCCPAQSNSSCCPK